MRIKESPCCAICFNNLAKVHSSTALFWMELCDFFLKLGGAKYPNILLSIMDGESTEIVLRKLETSGFLISTEKNEEIFVKLLGYKKGVFCLRYGRHD